MPRQSAGFADDQVVVEREQLETHPTGYLQACLLPISKRHIAGQRSEADVIIARTLPAWSVLKHEADTTTAGRRLVTGRSVKGKGTTTTAKVSFVTIMVSFRLGHHYGHITKLEVQGPPGELRRWLL